MALICRRCNIVNVLTAAFAAFLICAIAVAANVGLEHNTACSKRLQSLSLSVRIL